MMRRTHPDQSSLFGYISPVTSEVCAHPPLCACGNCPCPVVIFAPTEENLDERASDQTN